MILYRFFNCIKISIIINKYLGICLSCRFSFSPRSCCFSEINTLSSLYWVHLLGRFYSLCEAFRIKIAVWAECEEILHGHTLTIFLFFEWVCAANNFVLPWIAYPYRVTYSMFVCFHHDADKFTQRDDIKSIFPRISQEFKFYSKNISKYSS